MKIDIFCHIVPQNYYDRMLKLPETGTTIKKRTANIPAMVNLDARFRIMDRFAEYCQVVSMAAPPIEAMGDAKLSPELAQIANDGLAELVVKHPDRFPGFVAALPMNNTGGRGGGNRSRGLEIGGCRGSNLFEREWAPAG